MRELDRIHRGLTEAAARGEAVMLATVLGVEGSVYRGAGARMIVTTTAETIGAVSGGCLEADIVARAPDVLARGRAELARYDTRASDDVVLGLGLGCQGLIDLLLEPLAGTRLEEAIAFYARLKAHRAPVTLLTALRDEPGGAALGARVVVDEEGDVIEGDATLLAPGRSVARELVRPTIPLVVCGAGTDAIPVVRLAKLMGWDVTVVDHRAAFVTPTRFPDANALVCVNLSQEPGTLGARVTLDARTFAVVMAHSATHDGAYLHAMLDAGAGYIGVLGPRRRTLELLGERMPAGGDLPDHVYAPVGLDLGAETPEEIALSIVSEIAAVSAGREGGVLRARRGPIHDRASHSASVDA
jgi:xanthine/CO dehydrogenase XdhC/CoxF family maturation factor